MQVRHWNFSFPLQVAHPVLQVLQRPFCMKYPEEQGFLQVPLSKPYPGPQLVQTVEMQFKQFAGQATQVVPLK